MAVSKKISGYIETSSLIRRMFETGIRLKEEHGAHRVCDLSLGNPSSNPPAEFIRTLADIAGREIPRKHSYMPNAGYPDVREKIAAVVNREQGVSLTAGHVVMTCGAGGGLNVVLKTLLDPGDTVLVSTPYFMEYKFYADNNGGILKTVKGRDDFDLDPEEIGRSIDASTKVVLLNSPNNPSGRIYPEKTIKELAALLEEKSREIGHPIYIISDEPYRKIAFNNREVPGLFRYYTNTVIVYSYSKEFSIPGERIGWLAIHPGAESAAEIHRGCTLCSRILGFVNAPALMQRVVGELAGSPVDISAYAAKKELLCRELKRIGYSLREPDGTFYLFPEAPGGDDLKTVEALRESLVLVVPGRGFGSPGYFRVAFCVEDDVIERSIGGFEKAFRKLNG